MGIDQNNMREKRYEGYKLISIQKGEANLGDLGDDKERFDDFFDGAVTELLSTHYPTREAVEAATWEEVEASLRRHQVSGGLSIERRRMLWDAYAQGVLS